MVGAGNFGSEVTDGYGDVSGKAFALPIDGGATCRTEIKGQRVPALGFPAPRRSLTGEGDLLAVGPRLVADHGTSAVLPLLPVAHGEAGWVALNLKTELPATAGGTSGHHRFAPWLSIGRSILRMSGRFGL